MPATWTPEGTMPIPVSRDKRSKSCGPNLLVCRRTAVAELYFCPLSVRYGVRETLWPSVTERRLVDHNATSSLRTYGSSLRGARLLEKIAPHYARMQHRVAKSTSIHEGFVGHPLELATGHDVAAGQYIDQEDADHVFFGINPETGSRRTAPIVFALGANVR